jgi:hypothetical protein
LGGSVNSEQSCRQLLKVVLEACLICRFPNLLNCWKKQADQDGNDRDYDQKLD